MAKTIRMVLIGLVLTLLLTFGISTSILAAEPAGDGESHSWGECSEGAGPGLENCWGKNAHEAD